MRVDLIRQLKTVGDTAVAVIAHPIRFFQTMPHGAGLRAPMAFLFVMGIVDALLVALFMVLAHDPVKDASLLIQVLLFPVVLIASSFLLATIFFIFWKLMGSTQSYATAYHVFAYSYAITPITTVLGLVPYLAILGFLWWFGLLLVASIYVQRIKWPKAAVVFGILAFAVLVYLVRIEDRILRPQSAVVALSANQHQASRAPSSSRAFKI